MIESRVESNAGGQLHREGRVGRIVEADWTESVYIRACPFRAMLTNIAVGRWSVISGIVGECFAVGIRILGAAQFGESEELGYGLGAVTFFDLMFFVAVIELK